MKKILSLLQLLGYKPQELKRLLYGISLESIECGPQCTLVTGSAVTRGRGRGTGES